MLRFANAQLAADYTHEFEQMYAGRFGTSKTSGTPYPRVRLGTANVEVYFSPEDGVAKHVLQRLEAAQRSIHFIACSYTSTPIVAAMFERARARVQVQRIFEIQNAEGSRATFGRVQNSGVDVAEDGNYYILHHKVVVIDDHIVISGSYNFTKRAEHDNDENLVIVEDAAVARA